MGEDSFEEFLSRVAADLRAADLDTNVGLGRVRLITETLRLSAQMKRGARFLTPEMWAALQADPNLVVEAARALAHWSVRADPAAVRAFILSELTYGPAATREHSPYVMNLPAGDGSPIGIAGSERLRGITAMIESRAERDGFSVHSSLTILNPYLSVSDGPVTLATVSFEELVEMYETGADDGQIAEALTACAFSARKALFVLRDGIAVPLAEGAL